VNTSVLGQHLGLVRREQENRELSLAKVVIVRECFERNLQGILLRDRINASDQAAVGDCSDLSDCRKGIMVVDHFIRSVLLDEIKVSGTGSCDDLVSREFGELNSEETDTGGSAVDEEPLVTFDLGGRVGDVESLVEGLAGGAEADTVDGGFSEGDLGGRGGNLPCGVARYPEVFYMDSVSQVRGKSGINSPAKAPRSVNCPP
jgi:hypothetical protein